jgi:hypothetical protein
MFGIFKKNEPTYPIDDRWSVHQGTYSGKPMFLRRNDSAQSLRGHPAYRFRVGVAIPLKSPNADGLPGNDEMSQLNEIEDRLASRLQAGQQSLFVLGITTGGMREFIFYTRDAKFAHDTVGVFRSEVSSHEVQGYVAEDPKWSMYGQFA